MWARVWLGWTDGRARQAHAKRRAAARAAAGCGLRGARVQARLGRRKGWEDGQADSQLYFRSTAYGLFDGQTTPDICLNTRSQVVYENSLPH